MHTKIKSLSCSLLTHLIKNYSKLLNENMLQIIHSTSYKKDFLKNLIYSNWTPALLSDNVSDYD